MKKINWWLTNFEDTEKRKLLESFDFRKISMGSIVSEFEEKLAKILNVKYAVITNSGTSAITMALLASGINKDDEVIVPALTWIATANAVAILGAKPILIDCDDRGLLNTNQLEALINKKTRAIIPVHLNGKSCNMKEIKKIANKNNLIIIEDACKSFLSKNKNTFIGTNGKFGCFSFGMISLLPMGYGGMIVTNNRNGYEKLKLIRGQGAIYRNFNEEKYILLGSNFKVSDLLTSLAVSQFERINNKIKKVEKIYKAYEKGLKNLKNIKLFECNLENGEVPLCAEALCKDKNDLINFMKEKNVELLSFHLPLNEAKYFKNKNKVKKATKISKQGLILPCGPGQSLKDIDICISLIQEWDKNYKVIKK